MTEGIRYARNGGVAIAYQVVGEGEVDLVPDFVSNLVFGWQFPRFHAFYERLAASFRLILFDKRGTGLSDHGSHIAALETRMEDLHAVLDAAGSSDALVLASHEGCGMAILFAATYPERTRALALFHPAARGPGTTSRESQEGLGELRERWGTQEFSDELLQMGAPTLYASETERRWHADLLRVGASPAAAYALNRAYAETDLRDVLPAVRVPTLVLYRSHEYWEPHALDVAALIPTARTLRVSGQDGFDIDLSPEVPDELERFVRGENAPVVPESVLATLVFTDLVGSTERTAELGDKAWRDLLVQHNAIVRRELRVFGARSGTPQATASLPTSTARRVQFVQAKRSSRVSVKSEWTCASVSTSANASCTRTRCRESR